MSTKRMLIDASHPEETRVVVLDGTKLEGYDVEVASRRQLKGNIYLAKVTRVEPSLQAAFVEYGGNRHGFLAFNEIHPDYYQIPVADRQALMAEASDAADETDDRDDGGEDAEAVEVVGGDDDEELERRPQRFPPRHYKIQEVIKRRQILLVQVVKEERGNKGAALTTYLSLAGRYCVLMPNTSRGGGISRKISSLTDRKRLKKILGELEVPEGMGVIVRTAGSGRTKAEIKRDYEYLMRLWSNIRETTLSSIAPALVYEEASLIKRSIRDLYGRDTDEILIQGEPEYRIAKEFMKLFIPSHAKRVKLHDDSERPLFSLHQVESQLDAMHLPTVPLKSGGYIVINPTEALVSIDVNSGRATRERHIEETALRTNLEAADEVARQLRLRDLAGLIVIDFIDMENSRNQGQVERRVKDAMKMDRARIQLGRISAFGLLELSRQRLRPSLLETSFETCPYCSGMGVCRTTESTVLSILRKIEAEGQKGEGGAITITAAPPVAMYLLNTKRKSLAAMEQRFRLNIIIAADSAFAPAEHSLERTKGEAVPVALEAPVEPVKETTGTSEADADEEVETAGANGNGDDASKRSRRRRPRRRRRTDEEGRNLAGGEEAAAATAGEGEVVAADAGAGMPAAEDALGGEDAGDDGSADEDGRREADAQDDQDAARKRRRRGKRGGRRRPRRADGEAGSETAADGGEAEEAVPGEARVADLGTGQPDAADVGTPDVDGAGDAEHGDGAPVAFDASAAGSPAEAEADADTDAASEAFASPAIDSGTAAEEAGRDVAEAEASAPSPAMNEEERESFEIVSYPSEDPVHSGADDPVVVADGDVEVAADNEPAVAASASTGNGHGSDWAGASGDGTENIAHDYDHPDVDPVSPVVDAATSDSADGDQPEEDDAASAARTEVIHVGADGDAPTAPRRGWWQRLTS